MDAESGIDTTGQPAQGGEGTGVTNEEVQAPIYVRYGAKALGKR